MPPSPVSSIVRPVERRDRAAWLPLWEGYNAFYGRSGPTALPTEVTASTWERFFDPGEPVFALVAELDASVVGLAHYLFHRSTNRIEPVCYLQDLFTARVHRGRGIGRAMILGVGDEARRAGAQRLYWHTHESNAAGRALYDKVASHAGFIVYTREPA